MPTTAAPAVQELPANPYRGPGQLYVRSPTHEVLARLARLQTPAGTQLPPRAELLRNSPERLILERVQLQAAAGLGLKIDEAALVRAEENVARQNGLSDRATWLPAAGQRHPAHHAGR